MDLKKDKIKLFRTNSLSMYEYIDWNKKALKRKLVSKNHHEYIFSELQKLPKPIHKVVKFTNDKLF